MASKLVNIEHCYIYTHASNYSTLFYFTAKFLMETEVIISLDCHRTLSASYMEALEKW